MADTRTQTDAVTAAPSERFLSRISRDFARDHLLLSRGIRDGAELLMVAETTPRAAVHNTGVELERKVSTSIEDGETIARLIDRAYASRMESPPENSDDDDPLEPADLDRVLADSERDLLATASKAPIVKLVDALLFDALGRGASDLHVQPLTGKVQVRVRIDGVLQTVRELSANAAAAVVSRIKVMGGLDIAERRVPQDGRATVTVGHGSNARAVDLRISTMPTSYGERAVVRLLDPEGAEQLHSFEALGMPEHVRVPFLNQCRRTNGIVLVTGPTGSGKTTTLYTTLRWVASERAGELNVMTVEDPIEYELSTDQIAISQSQINTRKGVTFATGLRHILRQDPDVVMVGEIRDAETARIAIQSSLTGHLVFSTLHTNDAPSAVTRLSDLGVESYLLSASVSAVLAQRLVRRVHPDCRGEGCDVCYDRGYKGRVGVYELLAFNDALRELVNQHSTAGQLREAGIESGMRPLGTEVDRLVQSGLTTRLEAERVMLGMA